MDQINSENPNIIKSLVWVSILMPMCSRRTFQMIRNTNTEKANYYMHLRGGNAFGGRTHRLLKEVLESTGRVWIY